VSLYGFIDTWKAMYGPRRLCRVLEVPESSYFEWNARGRRVAVRRAGDEAVLVERIRVFHEASDRTYGSPRIHADLIDAGVRVSERRVAELMAEHGIVGLSGREHSTVTTRRDRIEAPFPDLVKREFRPAAPNTVWYGDITYIWVGSRFWYLATVIDASSKMVIGWKLADHMRAGLAVDALQAAIGRRGGLIPVGVIFHSDRGSQYTSHEFGHACHEYGILQSMGRRGVCFDNAGAESFFATIKRELIDRYSWKSVDQLELGVFSWIETWYNRRRRHSTLGYRTPEQAETEHRHNKQAS
jgi:transposase InsO family protein